MDSTWLSFIYELAQVENGQRKGYVEGVWKPHESPEGGLCTIAYGHKAKTQTEQTKLKSGITNEEAWDLFLADFRTAKSRAASAWNATQGIPFDNLDFKYQAVLVDIAFNTGNMMNGNGRYGWPKLAGAIKAGDNQQVYEQSLHTYLDSNGQRKKLTRRSNAVCYAIGLNFEPI